MLDSIFSSSRSVLSLQETLDLASFYSKTASEAKDPKIALVLCDDAEASLSQMKKAVKKALAPETLADQTLRDKIATVYFEHGKVLDKLGQPDRAQTSYKKAKKWGHEETKPATTMPVMPLFMNSASAVTQAATSTSMSAQAKSDLVDYLFEKALLTLSSLEVSNKPSLFLVYAHDNPNLKHPDLKQVEAKASTSKYLIEKLSQIRGLTLYSDQTPIGQAYLSSDENLKEDGKLEDILTNQLCLLPHQLRADVKPVDKVIVCCSDVLGGYLKEQSYKEFCDELKTAYEKDREAYVKDSKQKSTTALREVVKKFSEEEDYKAGFHHVLTEMAFLEIRAKYREGQHGIIPVSLTPNSYDYCLKDFIRSTTVRMEDSLRFDLQAKKGEEIYLNQGSHGVLFKVIERLLAGSNEAKTFLDKFWTGHSHVISRLKSDANFGKLEFAKLLDGIFDDIRTTLHKQLASTVQQEHEQLQAFRADPRTALKEQYFAALTQNEAFQETLNLYVEPRCRASMNGESKTFELLPQVQAFLKDKKVILLTGDSGAGKTTFNRRLEKHLWEHKKEGDAIPLFISLSSIDKPEHDLIAKALKKRGLSEFQIQKLKKENQRFVFILDGYDEIRQTQNLYVSNSINKSDGWRGQMVIGCRSEYLGQDYRSRFQPNPIEKDKDTAFQEVVVLPFSKEESDQYLEKYVEHNPTGWTAQAYQEAFSKQSNLKNLISNPFLLRVVLEALPYVEKKGKAVSAIQLRMDLYDQFVRQWFERNRQRLSTQSLTEMQKEVFRELHDDGFAQHGIGFVKELAVHLYKENGGNPLVEYSLFKDKGSWKDVFFGREEENRLLREAWPLIRSGTEYRFIHKSLLEYFVARSLFESFDECMDLSTRQRRGSAASVYSFEEHAVLPPKTQRDLSLSPKHWIGDLGVVRLLTDRVQQESIFKEQLLAIIERSKVDKSVRQTAANAMTILVRAGVQFNGADLKGIQIPGADLSFGVFDSAQLQGADLRKATLRTIWLRSANLSGAQMAGVQFGEWPYLQEEGGARSCAYSPDGKSCAVGLENGKVSVYMTSNWEKMHTLEGHRGGVNSVVYSPSGTQIASGSWDHTVRLWDAESGVLGHTLEGHTWLVTSVVYSPSGLQIASGSNDKTVRLWDAQSGTLKHTLEGHTSIVNSVVYSPSGLQIASGSNDKTVRLWDAESGTLRHTLEGHTSIVNSVVYSPSGKQLASGSDDKTVRVWDAHSGALEHTLAGHTSTVSSVVYSPSGKQLASGSDDKTVRLWDAESGALEHTLEGHASIVWSVVYSPSGLQIASGSTDKTVRLWAAPSGVAGHTLEGHTSIVNSVVYSPSGTQIASGSRDHTVRLWDAESGALGHTLEGHRGGVSSVVYSPSGTKLASGSSDKAVRVWDVHSGAFGHTLEGHRGGVSSVVYSPGGTQIASGSWDHTVRLWDAESGALEHTLKGHTNTVSSVVYSPSGLHLASSSSDQMVRVWEAESGALVHTLYGHTSWVNSVVYSPSGLQLASGSFDNTVRVWDAHSGALDHTLHGHTDDVSSVVYSPSGTQIASGSWDNTVRLWDAHSGALGHTLEGHTDSVSSVVYSPSGTQIASGSWDNTVRLWEAESGALVHTLGGHTDWVNSVVYSPNGLHLASGSEDKTVRLWDVSSGECLRVIQEFTGAVNSVEWKAMPDGAYLVTGSEDKSVRTWAVKQDREGYQVALHWSSGHDVLTVQGALLDGVHGLSEVNRALLKQRGANDRVVL
ncbi:NACHT domain-containing protein [Mycoavidus sp. HKI]|uniref:WD40 domain-containing protein n=1 Tax=Mycoavidus sp. HKI TaxID=2840467 RepID=UPI001CBBC1F1|nr:NACHT domain-containing protein [Mycoavidus sp. HKI]UAW63851.1 NACHT domain-containing protein [Mycoavidus sp. HKI]